MKNNNEFKKIKVEFWKDPNDLNLNPDYEDAPFINYTVKKEEVLSKKFDFSL